MLGEGLPVEEKILRLRVSMTPSRWNSLVAFETASRVEIIMFARS